MPIPKTRQDLLDSLTPSFDKLNMELDAAGVRVGKLPCTGDWNVKDLLAVRAWWTHSVVDWVKAGLRGETPVTPGEGYRWTDTPKLNQDIVRRCRRRSFRATREDLDQGYQRVRRLIDSLSDRELLEAGIFAWTGKFPVARWISINTTRQYVTARTLIRRALRNHSDSPEPQREQRIAQ